VGLVRSLGLCCVYSRAKVREPIEPSFGTLSAVGQGMGVLDGGPRAARGREGFGRFSLHWLNGVFECIF